MVKLVLKDKIILNLIRILILIFILKELIYSNKLKLKLNKKLIEMSIN